MSASLRIFVGWDRREPVAYDVCRFSLERRTSQPVVVAPIKLEELRKAGLYWRDQDPLASTEFTYTRFLTPTLAGFSGLALFCDCDFLWLGDVAELFASVDPAKAVHCVKHDYRPTEATKMDGKIQTLYPRKNWSSLMLFNCDHPSVRALTADVVNRETGAYLHQMKWVADEDIGELPTAWNWLEGWNSPATHGDPKAVHFTRGGPWFEQWREVDYADRWLAEREAMARAGSRKAVNLVSPKVS
jgi:hypothetical protein